MKIGIISAMDSEHRQLADRLSQKRESGEGRFRYVEGILGRNDVVLTQCGIGKVNAAVGAAELIRRHRPDCIVSTGVAGGIDAGLRVGDVVAATGWSITTSTAATMAPATARCRVCPFTTRLLPS